MLHRIVIALFLIACLLPLAAGLLYATMYSFGLTGILNHGFTWHYWLSLFENHGIHKALIYSIYIAFFSLSISLIFAFYVSYLLLQKPAAWKVKLLLLPVFFAPVAAAFIFYYLLSPTGIISRILYHASCLQSYQDFPLLVQHQRGIGMILTHVFLVFPFFSLHFYNVAKKENLMALKKLSFNLGCNFKQFFSKVYVPVLLKKTEPLLLLYFIFLMSAYEIPLYLGSQNPQMVNVQIAELFQKFDLNNIGVAYSYAVFYAAAILFPMSYYLFFKRKKLLF